MKLEQKVAQVFIPAPGQPNFTNFYSGIHRQALSVVEHSFNNIAWIGKSPILVDMNNVFEVFRSCPPLNIVLSTLARMFSNGDFYVERIDTGEKVEGHPLDKLIKRPNPLQNQEGFLYTYFLLRRIFGNDFIYENKSIYGDQIPKVLWHLNPRFIEIDQTGNWIDEFELSGIINSYDFIYNGTRRKFSVDEIMHSKYGISENHLLADSPLNALQLPIANSIGSLKTRNKFIYHGPKTMLSNASTDGGGGVPLDPDEKKRIEDWTLRDRYGLRDDQSHMIITDANLKASQLSFPTRDMMLMEESEESVMAFCGEFGLDRDCLPGQKSNNSLAGPTKDNAERKTYNSTIQPEADDFCHMIDDRYGLAEQGLRSCLDYSWMPVMQEDQNVASQEFLRRSQGLDILIKNGTISREQAATILKLEPDGSGESETSSAPAKTEKDPTE